jgi:hypothetical protein
MIEIVRVNTATFKENPRPFVQQAKHGKRVIVTRDGHDDFEVVPCCPSGAPSVSSCPLNPADYIGVEMNSPAFDSWEKP